ncbi:MAG: filamentous hemagglutinin family protein [Chthoniobacterales bacterium]
MALFLSGILFLSSGPVMLAQSARAVMSPAGGGAGGGRASASNLQNAGAATAALTASRAREALQKSDAAAAAMRALQSTARAVMTGYDGLHPEGLQPHPVAQWVGAKAPVSTVDANGNHQVEIVQENQNAFLYWNRFNVGSRTRLNFNQSKGGADAGKWIAFNKVMGSVAPSEIHGSITAQGQVYILNQNGIIFHNGSQVNTRGLVASSLPINPYFAGDPHEGIVGRGVLNNEDYQFLFSAMPLTRSSSYSDPWTPLDYTAYKTASDTPTPLGSASRIGEVVVQKGAVIKTPDSATKSGGRVMLVGPSVRNEGNISTPDGQTILAAGLQVGVQNHPGEDPSLRGLDVHIGRVVDANDGLAGRSSSHDMSGNLVGRVVNNGIIETTRGHVAMAGREIRQNGLIESTTSVTLNGRVDLLAAYNARVPETSRGQYRYFFDQTLPGGTTGSVDLGEGSVIRILPELSSDELFAGTRVSLSSIVSIMGNSINVGANSSILAPGANPPPREVYYDMTKAARLIAANPEQNAARILSGINLVAGNWLNPTPQNYSIFGGAPSGGRPAGSISIAHGAIVSAAGTTGTEVDSKQNFLTVELRGMELANSPLQRNGKVRGEKITLDGRINGTINGRKWMGTPLGDATAFAAIIERSTGELTAAGGSILMDAGESVRLDAGSVLDVSGGWIRYSGGVFSTTKLLHQGQLVDISRAMPDRVYDGIYKGGGTVQKYDKWGVTKTFSMSPLDPSKGRRENSYIQGADGGRITIQAPSMLLDGTLRGEVVAGPRQIRDPDGLSRLPAASSLALRIRSFEFFGEGLLNKSPYAPTLIFTQGSIASGLFDQGRISLDASLFTPTQFGNVDVDNHDGRIEIPEQVALNTAPGGSVILKGSVINLAGDIVSPGGTVALEAYNLTYDEKFEYDRDIATLPTAAHFQGNKGRGEINVAASSTIDVSGRHALHPDLINRALPVVTDGGNISLAGYSVRLAQGSLLDVSAGSNFPGIISRMGNPGFELMHGRAGSITIRGGEDTEVQTFRDGRLLIGSVMRGFAGAGGAAGRLVISAPAIQIGGASSDSRILQLSPDFFHQGGFADFNLSGMGFAGSDGTVTTEIPGIRVVGGTKIEPMVRNRLFTPNGGFREFLQPEGMRPAVSLSLKASALNDPVQGTFVVRGRVVLESGASILLAPQLSLPSSVATTPTVTPGALSIQGNLVELGGDLRVPGGSIKVSAASRYPEDPGVIPAQPQETLTLSPGAVLSAAGTFVKIPDPLGYRRTLGSVLPGGSVSLSGNMTLHENSLIDASGASGSHFVRAFLDREATALSGRESLGLMSGGNRLPTRVESSGGSIQLNGGEMLLALGNLQGRSGGVTATGGTLSVGSQRFYKNTEVPDPERDANLLVKQSIPGLLAGIQSDKQNGIWRGGYFAADSAVAGGFDNLVLGGNVYFSDPVSISLPGSLRVATGGVLSSDSPVFLKATHVALGRPLSGAKARNDRQLTMQAFEGPTPFLGPSGGPGSITVEARIIDLGTLLMRNVGSAELNARGGIIRGDGILNIAGNLTLRAAQVYPLTASFMTLAAYDPAGGKGKILVEQSGGPLSLPLSATGVLSLYASSIEQNGTLMAPFGTINLGWDGSGASPKDPVSGAGFLSGVNVPVTDLLELGALSFTSVSGIDPITGKGVSIPYGIIVNDTQWIDPTGEDIAASGLSAANGKPAKGVNLNATGITMAAGSSIDLRGGGDLIAYQWSKGLKGTEDIARADGGRFAIIPTFGSDYYPISTFANLNKTGSDPGYTSSSLSIGDRITLAGGAGLEAGTYTLLPARYAMMPGSFLVTPTGRSQESHPSSVLRPDGVAVVAGYRFNALNASRMIPTISSLFEIISPGGIAERGNYQLMKASEFLPSTQGAAPVLDAAPLVIKATASMNLLGGVMGQGGAGGRGALIDVSSTKYFLISGTSSRQVPANTIAIDASALSSWRAGSLVIGGLRTIGSSGLSLTPNTSLITVDNAGSPLSGQEIILASKSGIDVKKGASIVSEGSEKAADIAVAGNGAFLRLNGDKDAATTRSAFDPSVGILGLSIAEETTLRADSMTLNSSGRASISPDAVLDGGDIKIDAGRIALNFDTSLTSGALNLGGGLLAKLSQTKSLSLTSYSDILFQGRGGLGSDSLESLTLSAGTLVGDDKSELTVRARSILLENAAGAADSSGGNPVATGGRLSAITDLLTFGNGGMGISGFKDVEMTAIRGVLGGGNGNFSFGGGLNLSTPVISGNNAAKTSISTKGKLDVAYSGTVAGMTQDALASSLTLKGETVKVAASLVYKSGAISLISTTGDLELASLLDVGGMGRLFSDVTQFTDAGTISLKSGKEIILADGASLKLSAQEGGGSAGTLSLIAPGGSIIRSERATMEARAGEKGASGSLIADLGTLPGGDLAPLGQLLTQAGITGSQDIRIRNGNIMVSGIKAHQFTLSADKGDILVNGTIDASGETGGRIELEASGSVRLAENAQLNAKGLRYDAAGKGGSIYLSSGASIAGVSAGDAQLNLARNSKIELGVAEPVSRRDQFGGTLHLRTPQSRLAQAVIDSQITGASSIVLEGYTIYQPTAGLINPTLRNQILADAQAFFGSAGGDAAGVTTIKSSLLAGLGTANAPLFNIAPGVEIINRSGNLTLSSDWDLSSFRVGANRVPGYLSMRASGDVNFQAGGLSDGFLNAGYTANLMNNNGLLPHNFQSWSYEITAGANLASANASKTLEGSSASVWIGKPRTDRITTTTASALSGNYQVLRTGTGDIAVNAAGNIRLMNQFATIYTAGAMDRDQTLGGTFDKPRARTSPDQLIDLGGSQQGLYVPDYAYGGGNITLSAGGNIERLQLDPDNSANYLPDSSRQLPLNWLSRRGAIGADGAWISRSHNGINEVYSTTWWINYPSFFEGIGTLGGGNITMIAGDSVSNVDAVLPTQARLTGKIGTEILSPSDPEDLNKMELVETGGGDLVVKTGQDLDAGVYYVERGTGELKVGRNIISNPTRDVQGDYLQSIVDGNPLNGEKAALIADTFLPTSFLLGKGEISVRAAGDALLGPVGNLFLQPPGLNNDLFYKTYFSTYGGDSSFSAVTLAGGMTLRTKLLEDPAFATWLDNSRPKRAGFTSSGHDRAGAYQPWILVAEESPLDMVDLPELSLGYLRYLPLVGSLLPPDMSLSALGGDLQLQGNMTIAPSPVGNLSMMAEGSINGISRQIAGQTWTVAGINISDASPNSIPGVFLPKAQDLINKFSSDRSRTISTYLAPTAAALTETASYLGVSGASLEGKLARHDQSLLHRNDTKPVRITTRTGSLSGLELFSPKRTEIVVGGDLFDVSLAIQNLSPSDVSLVAAGREMRLYDQNNPNLRAAIEDLVNLDVNAPRPQPRSGDIQISGPGTLQVLAGGNINLGTGDAGSDGTGVGISSIGNARNPALPFEGASIITMAGAAMPGSLADAGLDAGALITKVSAMTDAKAYFSELKKVTVEGGDTALIAKIDQMTSLQDMSQSSQFTEDDKARLALSLFYIVLREAGRDYNDESAPTYRSYRNGIDAIAALLTSKNQGDVIMNSRNFRTKSDGAISILAPGGGVSLASYDVNGAAAEGDAKLTAPPGIVTEAGGSINIFTKESVSLGIGRIFTLRGGDIMIWSDQGDIAAGASAKTVATAPPTRVLIDPQSGAVETDLAGLATGGGIGVLATVKGVPPGNVDLIAPTGVIDAGDAGIRSTGNLNLAATRVLNANNISAGGTTSGAPPAPPPPAAPNVSGATAASAASAGNNASAQAATKPPSDQPKDEAPSVISVEVLGYGGGDAPVEEESKKSAGGASMSPPQASL